MPIKQYNDTSSVSVAYALVDSASATEVGNDAMFSTLVPFTSEGFEMSKETKTSTAMTGSRRPNGSKNTKGSATGSLSTEFGFTQFTIDMLAMSMMNRWEFPMDGGAWITDGDVPTFFFVEKREIASPGGTKTNFFQRYYGNMVNEATIEFGDGELVSFQVNTMAASADLASAEATTEWEGSLLPVPTVPESYEIADTANNISKAVLKDDQGNPLPVTWKDFSLSISNNVRVQPGVGYEFAAGMSFGKVNATLSGTVYFYDDTLLKTHMENGTLSAEITIETEEGSFVLTLPALRAESPQANAQSENEDYTQSLTLTAERGKVTIEGEERECVIAIVANPTDPSMFA